MTAGRALAACVDLAGFAGLRTGLLHPGSRARNGCNANCPAALAERGAACSGS